MHGRVSISLYAFPACTASVCPCMLSLGCCISLLHACSVHVRVHLRARVCVCVCVTVCMPLLVHARVCTPACARGRLRFQPSPQGESEALEKRVRELQDDLAAVQFTPHSKNGKMLMAKCRTLQEENERQLQTLPTRLPPPGSKKWLESVPRIETE